MSDLVILEDRGAYALLRLNRAEKRNALNTEARAAIRARLRELRTSHKVIVFTGTDESFCSGMDLKEFATGADAAVKRENASQDWISTLLEIRRHPAIFISAVNGVALGGGTSLINAADLAIAADEAQIGMPEMGFGTYPAMAGPSTQLMLSPKRAAWMVLTAKRIDGQTAERWGLVNQSVPRARLAEAYDELALHIAQLDAVALTEAKRALEAVPNRISEWPAIMQYGSQVNDGIRARSQAQAKGLAQFAAGTPNVGQGQ
jgi:enoyl-CoA hydratase/carnithine racemase